MLINYTLWIFCTNLNKKRSQDIILLNSFFRQKLHKDLTLKSDRLGLGRSPS
ncbi:MAG: hypothetical protein AAGF26_14465 [Cyanobacteria bacterium P01_G01_bin.49]